MQIIINNEQEVVVTLAPTSAGGHPAEVENPEWEVIDGNSTVTPSEDGLSAILRSEDGIGDTYIRVSADADLGSGVNEISDTIELVVRGAQAQSIGLQVGEPRPKTAPEETKKKKKEE